MIVSPRLVLVVLDRAYLECVATRRPRPERAFVDPDGFLDGAADVAELRLAQIDEDPTVEPWLLRAMVVRETRAAIGFLGFHAAPDARGMVEIGYEVLPAARRQGYAREAIEALIAWAA